MPLPTKPDLRRKPGRRVAAGLPRFEPGDLVTAEALNRLVDAINALAARVAALEAKCG